jgi:hypothetical protein
MKETVAPDLDGVKDFAFRLSLEQEPGAPVQPPMRLKTGVVGPAVEREQRAQSRPHCLAASTCPSLGTHKRLPIEQHDGVVVGSNTISAVRPQARDTPQDPTAGIDPSHSAAAPPHLRR